MADPTTYPVELTLVAVAYDPETREPLVTVTVDAIESAPMQSINLGLDRVGFSPMFLESGSWRTSQRGARRN